MTETLPIDGQHIVFDKVTDGSPFKAGVVYRCEHKPFDRDWLLINTATGHALRVMGADLAGDEWHVATTDEAGAAVVEAPAPEASSSATPSLDFETAKP